VSLLVASKFHDVNSLTLDFVHTKLMKSVCSRKDIANAERTLLLTLDWQVSAVTPLKYIAGELRLDGYDEVVVRTA
jgi:hypothetical protein